MAKISKLTSQKCPRCDTKNAVAARFCQNYGMPLDLETALKVEEYAKKEHLIQDEILDAMTKGDEIRWDQLAKLVAKKLRSGV